VTSAGVIRPMKTCTPWLKRLGRMGGTDLSIR